MTRKSIHAILPLVLCGFGLLFLGCPKKETLVGVVLPLTGEDSVYGEAVRKGIELAHEELVADPAQAVALTLAFADSESDPEKAKAHLDQQVKDGALLAIGGVTSAEAKAMLSVADRSDRVLMSPTASSPELTGLSRNFYRIWPSDFAAASKMAQFISQDLDIKEVVVIAVEQDYAKGIQGAFQTAFEGYEGKVLETIEFPLNTTDLNALIGHAMTFEPKAVYLAGYGEQISAMIAELRKLKYEGKILTTSAFASPSFIVPLGEPATGVILTQSVFEPDSEHAHVKTFVEKFEAKYGEPPDIFAAHGYDALKVIAQALVGHSALPSEVPKGLRGVKDFPGVTGSISFNEKGDALKYPRVYIIGKDLLLHDYSERVRAQQEEIRKRREELQRRLEDINRQAQGVGG